MTLGHGENIVVIIFGHGYAFITNVRGMFLSLVLVMGTIKTISNDENGGPEGPGASQGCIVSI